MITLKFFRNAAALLIVLLFMSLGYLRCAYGLINYDNHPDLAKAMEFDLEAIRTDPNKADRSKAEYHYLRYLEDVNDSFQRARVYCRLGEKYSVSFNKQKGEKPDYDKAVEYYKKVLQCEPERIGRPTMVARSMLIGLDNPAGFERVKAHIEFHEWLASFDDQKIKEKWLPLMPSGLPVKEIRTEEGDIIRIKPRSDPNLPTPEELVGMKNAIEAYKEVAILNAAEYDAMLCMENPEKGLRYILDHLPTDAPERGKVEKLYQRVMEKLNNQ